MELSKDLNNIDLIAVTRFMERHSSLLMLQMPKLNDLIDSRYAGAVVGSRGEQERKGNGDRCQASRADKFGATAFPSA